MRSPRFPNGKIYYFGSWSDPVGALEEYLQIKEELQAGIDPRIDKAKSDGLTLDELCNSFLHIQKSRADSGEISQRTWMDRRTEATRLLSVLNRQSQVNSLTPADFGKLRNELAKLYGPVVLKITISRIKSMFRWAYESELIEKPVRFGPDFKPPAAKAIRKSRHATGKLMFSPAELQLILSKAKPSIRAMVLLAINAAYGNTDIAELPVSAVNLESGWLDHPRPKTGINRRCPLWPETVAAIQLSINGRPAPKVAADANLAFLTHHGERWVRTRQKPDGSFTPIDSISREFSKLLSELKLKRDRLNFYSLRHTHRTVADAVKDRPAVDHIMGHAPSGADMRAVYVEEIEDSRLLAVTNHVHDWLFSKKDGESC